MMSLLVSKHTYLHLCSPFLSLYRKVIHSFRSAVPTGGILHHVSFEILYWDTAVYTRPTVWLMLWLQLRFNYDPTTMYRAHLLPFNAIRHEQKMNMNIVVGSQLNQTRIVISITFVVVECVVVSSYHSRIVVKSQLWYSAWGVVAGTVQRTSRTPMSFLWHVLRLTADCTAAVCLEWEWAVQQPAAPSYVFLQFLFIY